MKTRLKMAQEVYSNSNYLNEAMSKSQKYYLILILNFCSCLCFIQAQNETAQWYFGYKAGLNFQNGSPPQSITNSYLSTMYGSSSISDSLGNLLFAVRAGDMIYNKQNDTMANGQNIGGYYGGVQTSIVLRKSGMKYYVVTHNNQNYFTGPPNLPMMNYAIVDMALASGLGSVVVSGQSITPVGLPFVSKMAATKHCNGKDDWLLFHEGGNPGSTNFYCYLVNSTSISVNPVITSIGCNQPQAVANCTNCGFYHGMHKFSPNGRKVCATYSCQKVELYDFDNATGVLSNMIVIDTLSPVNCAPGLYVPLSTPMAVGIEFSPDGSKLYISYLNVSQGISQFDLSAGSASAIAASKTAITPTLISSYPVIVYMQLAKDNKIYVAGTASTQLSLINNPDNPGITCNFQLNAVPLGTIIAPPYIAMSGFGLPAFESSFFEKKPSLGPFTSTLSCGATTFSAPALSSAAGYSVTAYLWNFGDPLSGNSNTSAISNPQHIFSSNGTYTVKLTLNYFPCGQDTLKQIVNVTGLPLLAVSGKTTICRGETTNLIFGGATTYSVNAATSQSTAAFQPTLTTTFTLSGKDQISGCLSTKLFKITVLPCLSIDERSASDDLRVYPIPTDKYLNIDLGSGMKITISDVPGKVLFDSYYDAGKHTIDLSSLKPGIYFLTATNRAVRSIRKIIVN